MMSSFTADWRLTYPSPASPRLNSSPSAAASIALPHSSNIGRVFAPIQSKRSILFSKDCFQDPYVLRIQRMRPACCFYAPTKGSLHFSSNRRLVRGAEKKDSFLLIPSIGRQSIESFVAEELSCDSRDLTPPSVVRRTESEPDSEEQQQPGREQSLAGRAVIKVIGVGGGGCNAINQMVSTGLPNVQFWAVNTDVQALKKSLAPNKLQIGPDTTYGRGTGGQTELGEEAATESLAELSMALEGADLVFVAAGMGGGTGSGAGPVVARLAKAMGALTVGIVTEPFTFEGLRRAREARIGVEAMKNATDTLVVVPNDRLLENVTTNTSIIEAFRLADDVLRQGVQGISDIITIPGLVNVDFADVKAIMLNSGVAMLGIGQASGKNRAEEVARLAIMSPLIHSPSRPSGIVYNVTGGPDLTLHEVNVAAEIVYNMADPNANVIFGAVIDKNVKGMIRMTVIATGFREPVARGPIGLSGRTQGTRTIEDDIFYWEQNPHRQKLVEVPGFLRRQANKRSGGIG